MKDTFSQQRKARPTITLSFDQFELGHVSLNHAIIDPPGETSFHRVFVLLHSHSKRLEFGKSAAFHLIKPAIKVFSTAGVQHLDELLNQIIGPIDFRVESLGACKAAPAPRQAVFQGDEETKKLLVVR